MFGGRKSSKFGSWRLRGHPQIIEYSQPVLNRMLVEVLEGYGKISHGGLAIGGVLFGEGDRHLVRVLEIRPIACDHSSGPSFTLSANDHDQLAEFLDTCKEDPELDGLTPVGWYHSHTRAGLNFTPSDFELHQRHFTEPWHIAIVFRPDPDKGTSAGLFVQGDSGSLPTEPALVVEDLRATIVEGLPEAAIQKAAQKTAENEQAAGQPEPEAATEPVAERSIEVPASVPKPKEAPCEGSDLFKSFGSEEPAAFPSRTKKWVLGTVGVAAVGGGLWAAQQYLAPSEYREAVSIYRADAAAYLEMVSDYWRRFYQTQMEERLSLRALASGSMLLIRWDSTNVVRGAHGGLLEITEGSLVSEQELDIAQLMQGSYSYQRMTGNVGVRMSIYRDGSAPFTESTHFIGDSPLGTTSDDKKVELTPEQVRAEMERMRAALLRQVEQTRAYEGTLRALRELEQSRNRVANPPPFTAPPPETPVLTQKAPAKPTGALVLQQRPGSFRQQAPRRTQAAKPAYSGPSSGKLIWTGVLPAGQLLTIDNGRPSTGNLSGKLPAVAVRITACPAALSGSGLTVYCGQPRRPATEQPSARNFFNRTTYEVDTSQSQSVSLLESPAESNGWDRVSVRAIGRSLSVVVIDWQRRR